MGDQDRLRRILATAAEAARAHPDWQDGDELVVILGSSTDTVLTAWGFREPGGLARCLEFHAGKARAGQAATDRAAEIATLEAGIRDEPR